MSYKTLYWEDVRENAELPVLIKEITATTIVAGSVATRDFNPLHHDRDYAQAQGAKDMFMSVLNAGIWAGRYLTDWTGPEGEIRKVSYRLGASCFPGDTLTWKGKVIRKYVEAGAHLVDIECAGIVPAGNIFAGTATVALPVRTP